jgi:site-specific DNA-methyltransferase (adenine-specific)
MTARLPRNQVLVGDAAERLAELPAASVDMVLTSPPYFRLRDYDVDGQLGLEQSVDEWVDELVAVAAEAARVLVPTGSLWLNVSDTYATHSREGAERKSLLLGPERLALRLLGAGWRVRNKIVWQKANPMPTSVPDRLACTWEALYVFVRAPRYFFDLDAVRVPHTSRPSKRRRITAQVRGGQAWRGPNAANSRWLAQIKASGRVGHPLGKNPGDVWRIASNSYRGGHHSAFPVALAERAIAAGCPELRCLNCHKPYRRVVTRTGDSAVRGELAPTCGCRSVSELGLVLDPFMGSGTTGVAADKLGRDWLGIELNPSFAALAAKRVASEPPPPVAQPPPAA